MANTKKLITACTCTVAYTGAIDVPEDYTLEQAIEYAREHIKEIPIASDLHYIGDTDELVDENCSFEEMLEGGVE